MSKKISKKKNKIGRPTKLTKEMQDEFVDLIKASNFFETACVLSDVHKSTAYDWIKKANESNRNNRYVRFRNAVEKAKALVNLRMSKSYINTQKPNGKQQLGN